MANHVIHLAKAKVDLLLENQWITFLRRVLLLQSLSNFDCICEILCDLKTCCIQLLLRNLFYPRICLRQYKAIKFAADSRIKKSFCFYMFDFLDLGVIVICLQFFKVKFTLRSKICKKVGMLFAFKPQQGNL